jgi:hypothetical protein
MNQLICYALLLFIAASTAAFKKNAMTNMKWCLNTPIKIN